MLVNRPVAQLLPPGLQVRRAHESLEVARSKTGEIRLLATKAGTELVKALVKKGKRVTLVPSPGETKVTEIYFVLSGALRWISEAESIDITAGDYLIAQDLNEEAIFEAQTDVEFLYLTFQPFFHHISATLKDLMDLAVEVEEKDGYTAGHCERIQTLAYATGRLLGLSHHRLHDLDYGAYLHDVGKVNVPLNILTKPSTLTPTEWKVIKQHPLGGKHLIETTFMKSAAPIVLQHHERLDGSGYPHGLAGDEILTEAYIVAVADVYDAMTSDRPYRRALSHEHAIYEIERFAGVHYPSKVIEAFFAALNEHYLAEPKT